MSEHGEIYTAGKNFTLPPAVTAWTNLSFVLITCILQDNYIQTRVSAEVVDPKTGDMSITNVFHSTFLAKEKTPPFIVPKTYHEVA